MEMDHIEKYSAGLSILDNIKLKRYIFNAAKGTAIEE